MKHPNKEIEPEQFPKWLVLLIDRINESVSSEELSPEVYTRLLAIVPSDFTDWKTIRLKFLIFLLENCKKHSHEPVQSVIYLLNRELGGDSPSEEEWGMAESSGWVASEVDDSAASMAGAAAAAAAMDSASWAAEAASWTAMAAARSVARQGMPGAKSAAWIAAWTAAWHSNANYLCELFEAGKGEKK